MHTLVNADAIEHLRSMATGSVHCIVTSPPYFNQRDYGHDGQIGLEQTVEEYVAKMADVLRECRRVLRDDGVAWLNLGDSYNNAGSSNNGTGLDGNRRGGATGADGATGYKKRDLRRKLGSIKHKDLIGIPWRVALALQADGWWLRQDIIWHKPSPMPESVTDRCTKAHEYVFMLTKSPTYFFDSVAISEPSEVATRNRRSVWKIATRPYKGAHFATMPPELAEVCIKSGTSEHGCCPQCGSPWQRLTERTKLLRKRPNDYVKRTGEAGTGNSCANSVAGVAVVTLGWQQSCNCDCPTADTVPCVVLDPFAGSGTTLAVAKTLGRDSIGIELNPDYVVLAEQRIAEAGTVKKNRRPRVAAGQGSLFGD